MSSKTVLTAEQYRKLMLGEQYGWGSDGNIEIIPQARLMEEHLAYLNLNNTTTNKVRGGKSKRKKSRSNKRKNRRATKTRRYRK